MKMIEGSIEGNPEVWARFYNELLGKGFYKPQLKRPDPKWPKYAKLIGKRPSAYLKLKKVEQEVDLFEYQVSIYREGDDQPSGFGRRLRAPLLSVLADVPHRTENPNYPEFARRFGAQWGCPGVFLRFDDMVILGNPSTGLASDEVFYLKLFPEFTTDTNRLIRFGRVDRASATEAAA